ncbi:hypothetical protein ACFVXW_05770 [Streptomyces sp. NPDC058251]|uniref:hypothetical protein n=1 Tax=unclassified Streptomyces TaxID=2593676 RepID=UPI00365316D9
MSGTSGVRGGSVRVLIADDEPWFTALRDAHGGAPRALVLDSTSASARLTAEEPELLTFLKRRTPVIHPVLGAGYASRPPEEGR